MTEFTVFSMLMQCKMIQIFPNNWFKIFKMYLKERERERYKEQACESILLPTGSLPSCPQQLELGQAEIRNQQLSVYLPYRWQRTIVCCLLMCAFSRKLELRLELKLKPRHFHMGHKEEKTDNGREKEREKERGREGESVRHQNKILSISKVEKVPLLILIIKKQEKIVQCYSIPISLHMTCYVYTHTHRHTSKQVLRKILPSLTLMLHKLANTFPFSF